MRIKSYTRRKFIRDNALAGIGASVGMSLPVSHIVGAVKAAIGFLDNMYKNEK